MNFRLVPRLLPSLSLQALADSVNAPTSQLASMTFRLVPRTELAGFANLDDEGVGGGVGFANLLDDEGFGRGDCFANLADEGVGGGVGCANLDGEGV